jgi:hypothetical protein
MDPRFSLAGHVFRTAVVASVILATGVALAWGASVLWWLLCPVFWVIANFFEWAIHRFPMHRPLWPRVMYTNHALRHHRAFEGHNMAIEDRRELSLVMMPWYTLVMVFLFASPVALGIGLLVGPPVAGIFLIASVVYFFFYEVLHSVYHLPSLGRFPGWIRRLQQNHAHHHVMRNMNRVNFNVTVPLADWILGSLESSDETES